MIPSASEVDVRCVSMSPSSVTYGEIGCNISHCDSPTVQLPTSMPASRFQKLYRLGFPNPS